MSSWETGKTRKLEKKFTLSLLMSMEIGDLFHDPVTPVGDPSGLPGKNRAQKDTYGERSHMNLPRNI